MSSTARPWLRFAPLPVLIVTIGTADAGWTVVNLHPDAMFQSRAHDVHGSQQVGVAGSRAAAWSGTAASWVNIHPAGFTSSYCFGRDSQQIVGYGIGTAPRAALWNGTGYTPLWTAGQVSVAYSVDGGQQVGSVGDFGNSRAAIWNGTPAWTDLHPAGATQSFGRGVHVGVQAGYAVFNGVNHAGLWAGTAASWVDLHPTSASSSIANDVHAGQQIGVVSFAGTAHASYWTGTAASWVDIHPSAASRSNALRGWDGWQVGWAEINGVICASVWHGAASSWQNLALDLPQGTWTRSEALGVWADGRTLHVVGYAQESPVDAERAMLWTRELLPCPGDIDDNMQVNISDLLSVIGAWGACAPPCPADINDDGMVNIADLLGVVGAWGGCP